MTYSIERIIFNQYSFDFESNNLGHCFTPQGQTTWFLSVGIVLKEVLLFLCMCVETVTEFLFKSATD